jgi:hypothetical protein
MFVAQAEQVFASLPVDVRTEDTVLGQLMPALVKGKTLLPNDRHLPVHVLQSYDCPWSATVYTVDTTQGPLIAVCVKGEHNALCLAAGVARRIPVKLSCGMTNWVRECLQADMSVDQIEQVLFTENYPQKHFISPPPRPPQCWRAPFTDLSRFCPSRAYIRFLEQKKKQCSRFDRVDQVSLSKKVAAASGLRSAPLRISECACAQADPIRPVCMSNTCTPFRGMWMAPWQYAFFSNARHTYSTVFIDGTGQVNEYGYPLITAMVINPVTMRGIPIAHMVLGRSVAADLRDFLIFILAQRPSWKPQLFLIDKDLTEFNGINLFADASSLRVKLFICFFHVKQAIQRWMVLSKHGVPEDIRDQVLSSISLLHYAETPEVFEERAAVFLNWLQGRHPGLFKYFKEEWFCDGFRTMWSRCFISMTGDTIAFTNNFIEAWHKLLKTKGFKNKRNRRLDVLFDVLVVDMEIILFRALYHCDDFKNRVKFGKLMVIAKDRLNAILDGGNRETGVWQVRFGSSIFDVCLKGYFLDGPYCSCVSAESSLCVHILIVILAAGYSLIELLGFGFVGTVETPLTRILSRTFRGTSLNSGKVGEGTDPTPTETVTGQGLGMELDAKDQALFVEVLTRLNAAFDPWRQLTPGGRVRMRHAVWNHFRGLLTEGDVKQRTLHDNISRQNGAQVNRLPRMRGFAHKSSKAKASSTCTHPTVLLSYLTGEAALDSSSIRPRPASNVKHGKLPADVKDIKKGDELLARRCLGVWAGPAGNWRAKFTVKQLQIILKGLGQTYSGMSRPALIEKLERHDEKRN